MTLLFFICVLVTAAISSTAFFAFPQFELLSDKVLLALCFGIFIPQLMAAGFFLASLRAFKTDLRRAYRILAIGILLYTFTQLPLPLTSFFLIDPILTAWFTVITSCSGALVMYLGVRQFSKLLGIQSIWRNVLVAFALAASIGVAASFLPHSPLPFNEIHLDAIYGTFVGTAGFGVPAAILVLHIRKVLGHQYKSGLAWLAAALLVIAYASLQETVFRLVPYFSGPQFDAYYTYGLNLWPYILSSLLFLKASLSFKKTSRVLGVLPDNATYLDVINYMAQLVSNPQAIDVTLDKMRTITASHETGTALTADEKAVLRQVYMEIEVYLTTKEPLRKITKEDLRAVLPPELRQDLQSAAA